MSRRQFVAGSLMLAGAPMFNRGRFSLFAGSLTETSTAAIDLVHSTEVIDMLGLVTLNFPKLFAWQAGPATFGRADFQRLKESGITVFHPATGYTSGNIYQQSLADLTGWNRLMEGRPDYFQRILNVSDLAAVKRSGKIGILLGQQNSAHFRTVEDVNLFYGLGQRVSQLTYFRNQLGGGSTDAHDTGLSPFGRDVLRRMNEVGMAVDVSHCGDRTTLDALEASTKPVLITHSNCRSLVPGIARCKTDEAIRKVAAKGGVMGLTMVRPFVGRGAAITMEGVLDHVDHVARLVGVEHVGLGTDVDLDGRDHYASVTIKSDLDGVRYDRKIFDLAEGLLRRGYGRDEIELILGKNFSRALGAIWN